MTRYEREIAEAVGRAELASKPDEQRARWASAQNLGRQRASAQNGADFDETTRGVGVTAARARRGEVLGSSPGLPFIPRPPAPYAYRDPDVWYRRVGVAMCVISAAFVAYLAWQIVRWVL